jgi:hypothetical protein
MFPHDPYTIVYVLRGRLSDDLAEIDERDKVLFGSRTYGVTTLGFYRLGLKGFAVTTIACWIYFYSW